MPRPLGSKARLGSKLRYFSRLKPSPWFEKLFADEQIQLFFIDNQNPIWPHLQISTPKNGGASAVFKAGPLSGTVRVGNLIGLLSVFLPPAFAEMAKV